MTTKKAAESEPRQTQTGDRLYEVVTQLPNGHRTVHRLYAASQAAAVAYVEEHLDSGAVVVESGQGPLGSDPPG
jgi:hypothetical protein